MERSQTPLAIFARRARQADREWTDRLFKKRDAEGFAPRRSRARFAASRYLDRHRPDEIPVPRNRSAIKTQKPETLLERIIVACTEDGDTILDAYCGCGTTIAVAQKLNRKWIGIDITYQSISLLVMRRLEDTFGANVLSSITTDGIPKDMRSAIALAHKDDDRLRKEVEKWAVLTSPTIALLSMKRRGGCRG